MIDDLDAAGDEVRRAIAGSLPSKLDLPSPCEGWTVRDVINHVVTGNLRTLAWTDTEQGPPNEEDHLGRDPLAAFNDTFRQVRARIADLLARDASVQAPFAVLSAKALVEMRSTELAVHAWDIARATEQSTDFAPALCDRLLATARAQSEGLDRVGSPFAAARPSPASASAADRLAGYFGRSV